MISFNCKVLKGLKSDRVNLLIWVKWITFSPDHMDNQFLYFKLTSVFSECNEDASLLVNSGNVSECNIVTIYSQ